MQGKVEPIIHPGQVQLTSSFLFHGWEMVVWCSAKYNGIYAPPHTYIPTTVTDQSGSPSVRIYIIEGTSGFSFLTYNTNRIYTTIPQVQCSQEQYRTHRTRHIGLVSLSVVDPLAWTLRFDLFDGWEDLNTLLCIQLVPVVYMIPFFTQPRQIVLSISPDLHMYTRCLAVVVVVCCLRICAPKGSP